jgi:hypothetical protein
MSLLATANDREGIRKFECVGLALVCAKSVYAVINRLSDLLSAVLEISWLTQSRKGAK